MLQINNVSKNFGGLMAVNQVNIEVKKGEIYGLIGPNGAGKTTLFNLIAGVYRPSKGSIVFDGEDITHIKAYQVSRKGIARTFQIVKPFPELTVLKNVMVGAFYKYRLTSAALTKAEEIVNFVGLGGKKDSLSKNLPTGERKKLELARALSLEPKMLLMDETMAGLNTKETEDTIQLTKKIRDQGITIIIIEHNIHVITSLSDRVAILHHGEKIAEGIPTEVIKEEKVIKAYLGEDYQHAAN